MKKLLLLFTAFILVVFTNCKWDDKKKDDCLDKSNTTTEHLYIKGRDSMPSVRLDRAYRCNEYIISFCDQDPVLRDKVHAFLLRKGATQLNTCPCSGAIELWNSPVEPSPDGADATPPPGGQGWDFVKNFIVEDSTNLVDALNKSEGQLSDAYPPKPKSPTVNLAIDDSGVEPVNSLLIPYLYRNSPRTFFCGTPIPEGRHGMNILNKSGLLSPPPLNPSDPLDTDGHGTFIGGIVAGIVEPKTSAGMPERFIANNYGINIKEIHTKIFNDRHTGGDLFTALCGIHYCIDKKEVKVINLSWVAVTATKEEAEKIKRVFCPTMEAVKTANILLIAAAGNHSLYLNGDAKTWPACFAQAPTSSTEPNYSDYVLSVGSWDLDSTKIAYHSNFGTFVNMYAPGTNIKSIGLVSKGGIVIGKGTSYAAPYVSRISAILIGLHPGSNPKGIPVIKMKNHILKYSEPLIETYRPYPTNIMLLDAYNIMKNHPSL